MQNETNMEYQAQPEKIELENLDFQKNLTQKQQFPNILLLVGLLVLASATVFFAYKYYQLLDETKTFNEANEQVLKANEESNSTPTLAEGSASDSSPLVDREIDENLSKLAPETSIAVINQAKAPSDWLAHHFPMKNLVIHTPSEWQSSAENFADTASTLLRFWEAGDEKDATIQLNISSNWDNIGIGSNYTYFKVAESIQAYRIDPPKMEEKTLDRYQTNFYFERKGKVYSLLCVHNWMKANIETCEKMLQTMEFTD